jgi:cell division protein FtsL
MLIVICVLVYLYVSAGTSILSTWRSAASYRSQVAAMERQNRQLNGELTQLARPQTVVEQGRALGLARSTEVPFFTTGLPGN